MTSRASSVEVGEVDPPRLLVQTFDFESNEHGQSLERVEFEEVDPDRTRIVVTATFESVAARDAMLVRDGAWRQRGLRKAR